MREPVVGDRVHFIIAVDPAYEVKEGTCTEVHEDESIDIELDNPEGLTSDHIPFGSLPGQYTWPE